MKKVFLLSVIGLLMCPTIMAKGNNEDFITHCTITTYNPVKSQCNEEPLVTANGTKICPKKLKQGKLRYVAISRDLLWCIPYGSIIEIEGHGNFEVVDVMNKRYNHCIDILQDVTKPNFKKEKIKVKLLKKG